jgi:hypothetical protein
MQAYEEIITSQHFTFFRKECSPKKTVMKFCFGTAPFRVEGCVIAPFAASSLRPCDMNHILNKGAKSSC